MPRLLCIARCPHIPGPVMIPFRALWSAQDVLHPVLHSKDFGGTKGRCLASRGRWDELREILRPPSPKNSSFLVSASDTCPDYLPIWAEPLVRTARKRSNKDDESRRAWPPRASDCRVERI